MILLDTNIVLDVIQKREPQYHRPPRRFWIELSADRSLQPYPPMRSRRSTSS